MTKKIYGFHKSSTWQPIMPSLKRVTGTLLIGGAFASSWSATYNYSGQTINANQTYNAHGAAGNIWTYTNATIAANRSVIFTNYASITSTSNFDKLTINGGGSLIFTGNTRMSGTVSFNDMSVAGTFRVSVLDVPTTYNPVLDLTGTTVTSTGLIDFSSTTDNHDFYGVAAKFDNMNVSGTMNFYRAHTPVFSFTNTNFLAGSKFITTGSGWDTSTTSVTFNNAKVYGDFIFTDGSYSKLDMSNMTFYAGSTFTATNGNYTNAKFANTTFNGTFTSTGSNFTSADFSNATLGGTFSITTGTGAVSANFSEAKLTGNVTIDNIVSADFSKAVFSGTASFNNAGGAKFTDAVFNSGSVVTGTGDFSKTNYDRATFDGTFTTLVTTNTSSFNGATFAGTTDLKDVHSSNFEGASFTGQTTLRNAADTNFVDTIFAAGSETIIRETLTGSDFTNAEINGTFSSYIDHDSVLNGNQNVKFVGTKFNGDVKLANLGNSDFTSAVFSGTTYLENADSTTFLNNTFKNGSDTAIMNNFYLSTFKNATLETGSKVLINATLEGAKFDGNTVLDNILIQENAELIITGLADTGTSFTNSTINEGGFLKIAGWQKTYSGTIFENNNFNGNVVFGDYDNNVYNYVDFVGSSFKNSVFSGNVDFIYANLNQTSFDDTTLSGNVTFTGGFIGENRNSGYFQNASFKNAELSGTVSFTDMSMTGVKFDGTQFKGTTTFKGVKSASSMDLSNADFRSTTEGVTANVTGKLVFDNALLNQTRFDSVNFNATSENKTEFKNSNAANAYFTEAQFTGYTDFTNNTLSNAKFTNATFGGNVAFKNNSAAYSNFDGAKLTGTVRFEGQTNARSNFNYASFIGAELGSNVSFNEVDLSYSKWNNAVIDGVKISASTFSSAVFNGATIKGNTQITDYSWLASANFNNATFESSNNSQILFENAYLSNATFDNANFKGDVLFTRTSDAINYYDNADFSKANFNADSKVTFDGKDGVTFGVMKFAGNKNIDGNLIFKNIDMGADASRSAISFVGAEFGGTSNTIFQNVDMEAMLFDNILVESGGVFTVSEQSIIDSVSFANATFAKDTIFNFYDTKIVDMAKAELNFYNTQFNGITNFATDTQSTNLSQAVFEDASFNWDSSKGTMFFMQNTGITLAQLQTTQNFQNGKLDFRGMNLSGNAASQSSPFHSNDWRGAQVESAVLGGFYGNDFRDGTANAQTNYGKSYIAVDGKLGGLNNHTATNHNEFTIRTPNANSTLNGVYLQDDSTTLNQGVTLYVHSNNHIYANGAVRGLEVSGNIVMDSSSVFHMRNGASMAWLDTGTLDITINYGENYIVVADYDNLSSIDISNFGVDKITVHEAGAPEREWRFEIFEDSQQLVLYYIPEPSQIAAILGGLVLALAAYRRKK